MSAPLSGLDVSRETSGRMEHLLAMLRKWTPRINLVSRSTVDDAWTRHIADSAQLYRMAPDTVTRWADLGSGGGFPGLVIAILAHELNPLLAVTLVESDQRKCAFLRSVVRETGIKVDIRAARIETLDPLEADVLSARALADLSTLLGFAARHMTQDGTALFPKGASWEKEVDAARRDWRFTLSQSTSLTESQAVILKIGGISRV